MREVKKMINNNIIQDIHTKREGNKYADSLAKLGLELSELKIFANSGLPEHTKDIIREERLQLLVFRK